MHLNKLGAIIIFLGVASCGSKPNEKISLRCVTPPSSGSFPLKITRFLEIDVSAKRVTEKTIKELDNEIRASQTGVYEDGRVSPIATSMKTELLDKSPEQNRAQEAQDQAGLKEAQRKPLAQHVFIDDRRIEYYYGSPGARYDLVEIDRSTGEMKADFSKGSCVRDEKKF